MIGKKPTQQQQKKPPNQTTIYEASLRRLWCNFGCGALELTIQYGKGVAF
jgi:hypothetical protein